MSEQNFKDGKLGEKIVGAYKKAEDKFFDTFPEEDGCSPIMTARSGN